MKKYSAEFIGTMVLVLMGCGSAVIAGKFIGYAGISVAFGLSVLVMVYAIGSISGCHINPAITIAMLVANKIKEKMRFFISSPNVWAALPARVSFGRSPEGFRNSL